MRLAIRCMMIATIASLLSACTPSSSKQTSSAGGTTPAAADIKPSYVVTHDTPYYKNSPSQPMPADGTFRAGTQVSKLKGMGNYTLVRALDGTKAYVATSDIQPIAR